MSDLGWDHLTASDKADILRGITDGVAYGGPYHVEIYPADRCNISCFFCSTASIRGTDELPVSRVEELLGELRELGTRSVRLAGGGEPLFHRKTKPFLRAIASSGIPIENVTTNAVLLDEEVAGLLVAARCDYVTVSLNTADQESYSAMMRTPERNFSRVLDNIRTLLRVRGELRARKPHVALQFLVWRDNYKTIPQMYALARELEVDSILFNGLSFLPPEQLMDDSQFAEMMRLYEGVVRIDEFRRITSITSFERDITADVAALSERLTAERSAINRITRMWKTFKRDDFTLAEKFAHKRDFGNRIRTAAETEGLEEFCLIGWHSMVVRTSGSVAPCCILQGKDFGNIYNQPVRDVWYGENYQRFRAELADIMRRGPEWKHAPEQHRTVEGMCGQKGSQLCPVRSSYFRDDVSFRHGLAASIGSVRQ